MELTDVERDLLGGLGYLLVHANYLDDALVDLYWLVSGKTEVELIRTVRDGTLGGLCQLVPRAYERRVSDAQLLQQLAALKPKLAAALDVRNEFIHARYVFARTSLQHTRRPRRGPVVEKIRTLQLADLETAINVLGAAQEATYELYDATVEHIPDHEVQPRGGSISADGTYTPSASWALPTKTS